MSSPLLKIAAIALPIFALTVGAALAESPAIQSRRSSVAIDAPVDYGTAKPGFDANKVTAKDIADTKVRGADWLISIQKSNGGWGAGDWSTDSTEAPADVATTSLVVLALVRDAGGSERHRDAIVKGVRYVTGVVEKSPKDGPRLDVPEGTQPQYKLGQLVDTHMAAMMLGEITGTLDDQTNAMVTRAHDKVIGKVQMAQNDDGSFDSNGWAPVLSTSIAASSLDRAVELNMPVDDAVLERNDRYQARQVDGEGNFDTSAGAGVDLYAAATTLRGNAQAKKRAPRSSDRAREAEEAQAAAQTRITGDASGRLFSGFGSIGGEEMLSYMMISDTLAEEGGDDWNEWEPKVGAYLVGTQNNDGSWAGHHCITSRTFTTAAAMMTLGAQDYANIRSARITGEKPSKRASSDDFAPDHATTR
jgi:hypothetical protein